VTDTDDSVATPGVAETPRRAPAGPQSPHLPAWAETVLLIAGALVVAVLIKTFLVQAFYIPSGSMRQTLQVNDRILVEKWSYWFGTVQRGDVIVFDDPDHWLQEENGQTADNPFTKALSAIGLYPTGGHLVKRVIGVGGDRVACRHGHVLVNGQVLHERSYVTLPPQACTGTWAYDVPPHHLWVMGDNRDHSADSRLHVGDPGGGFIPVSDVVGKVFAIVWPPSRWQFLHRPATFDSLALSGLQVSTVGFGLPVGLPLAVCLPRIRRARRPSRR
jgi:signal peptidase I